eukprot:480854-Pelagomonas_calceolata.AAC.1
MHPLTVPQNVHKISWLPTPLLHVLHNSVPMKAAKDCAVSIWVAGDTEQTSSSTCQPNSVFFSKASVLSSKEGGAQTIAWHQANTATIP